ncbi:hypothetical protein, partial [Streptomyces sp. 4N124]|uniref:hypothetical protein n=1 Tax=Streptomyces sp. 4N124 TaxID=3457420 RepID=UPI003FD6AFE5
PPAAEYSLRLFRASLRELPRLRRVLWKLASGHFHNGVPPARKRAGKGVCASDTNYWVLVLFCGWGVGVLDDGSSYTFSWAGFKGISDSLRSKGI